MELLKKINVDLLVPLLTVFMLVRLKKYYCFPQKLFCGLRFFVSNICLSQKHLRAPQAATKISEQSFIDGKLHEYNLSMIELDGSARKGSILSGTLLYDSYETLVYLSLSSVLVHFFSIIYHCYSPTSIYSIWGSIFVFFSVILPFRLLIRILLMTGFAAFESIVAVTVSIISFVGSATLLLGPFDLLSDPLENVLSTVAVHCNALMLQFSSTAVQPSEPVMVAAIKIFLSFLTAMTALGMVLPALRFAQSFNTLLFGARYEKAPVPIQVLITIDHFLPLFVAASMAPHGLIPLSGEQSINVDAHRLCLQLFATMLMVAVRLSCMKRHIQCFLDVAVQTISTEMATSSSANVQDIQVLLFLSIRGAVAIC